MEDVVAATEVPGLLRSRSQSMRLLDGRRSSFSLRAGSEHMAHTLRLVTALQTEQVRMPSEERT